MKASELKAKLNNLTLVGYEDGEYQWMGELNEWDGTIEELEEYYWANLARNDEDYDGLDNYLATFNLE